MAINIDNINSAFNKVKAVANNISIISHSENVALENIVPSDYNPYNEYDTQNDNQAVRQLADSIAVQGLIEPIVLNKIKDKYIILSGERRYKAIKLLNWKSVPAQVYDNLDTTTANLILHTSNLEVRDYTSGQKLIFYKDVRKLLEDMKSKGQLTGGMQKALANMLHINERQVRKYERICNELSEDEQEQIINNEVSINDGYKVAQERKTERELNSKPQSEMVTSETFSPTQNKEDALEYEPIPQPKPSSKTEESSSTLDNRFIEDIQDNASEAVLDYVFRVYEKDKLLNFYKTFIPTENEAIDYLLSHFGLGIKAVVNLDSIKKTISVNDDIYQLSYIDMSIRQYIREEQ